ncbi:MAG: dTDP-glucose 4,6-dehydratase [Anaerolineae bacterium]|nr:dTDP-glucose 4,6-dehydratase [Gemmatimonadaceae bacterium]
MNVLVTGGLGFIGSNLIRLLLAERPAWRVVNLDLVTYAANPHNLKDLESSTRYRFVRGDIADRQLIAALFREENFGAVINCAAESHVDRSLSDSARFLRTNVEGTLILLEAALETASLRYLQMSTDEVYGSLSPSEPPFTEETSIAPRSPYSASKAAGDQMALAFHHSHGLDVIVTRCSNNYGPYQHPEKLIPLMITSALRGRRLPVYGDGRQRRDWIHVEDHCRAVLAALEKGLPGEVFNFGGGAERENLDVVKQVLRKTGSDDDLIQFVTDRPGHDRRYSVDFAKAERALGWRPARSFELGLEETIEWYSRHEEWWFSSAASAYEESSKRIETWEQRARMKSSTSNVKSELI